MAFRTIYELHEVKPLDRKPQYRVWDTIQKRYTTKQPFSLKEAETELLGKNLILALQSVYGLQGPAELFGHKAGLTKAKWKTERKRTSTENKYAATPEMREVVAMEQAFLNSVEAAVQKFLKRRKRWEKQYMS